MFHHQETITRTTTTIGEAGEQLDFEYAFTLSWTCNLHTHTHRHTQSNPTLFKQADMSADDTQRSTRDDTISSDNDMPVADRLMDP